MEGETDADQLKEIFFQREIIADAMPCAQRLREHQTYKKRAKRDYQVFLKNICTIRPLMMISTSDYSLRNNQKLQKHSIEFGVREHLIKFEFQNNP